MPLSSRGPRSGLLSLAVVALLGAFRPPLSFVIGRPRGTRLCVARPRRELASKRAVARRSTSGNQETDADEQSYERLSATIANTKAAASKGLEFTTEELDKAVKSLQDLADPSADQAGFSAYREFLRTAAHSSPKDWAKVEASAQALAGVGIAAGPDDPAFRGMFERALRDGGWDAAAAAAAARPSSAKPWAVLVCGLNGIRKTTCIYETWFREALSQALGPDAPAKELLPDGGSSFFRQLDYIIATAANEEFRSLYELTDVDLYASLKDMIFARYRTVAEIWGAVLVKSAREKRMNVMVETSGRDPGMFRYLDHFFPDESYNKLALHFDINDISFAEKSVDRRMLGEMRAGKEALSTGQPKDIVQANAGGPYGSKALPGVLADLSKVWERVSVGEDDLAKTWYKATISINAVEDGVWTVSAAVPDATVFTFAPRG